MGDYEMGMTNEQYKGILIDQKDDWSRVLKMVEDRKDPEVIEKEIRHQIELLDEKLKL